MKSGIGRLVVTNGRTPSLPKIQTGNSIIPSFAPNPTGHSSPSASTSPAVSTSGSFPAVPQDTASFAASLSSSLGLDLEDEMDLDVSMETESVATVDSGFGLADEPSGEDNSSGTNAEGLPVKLPPWARKRVRSTSFVHSPVATPMSFPSPRSPTTRSMPGTSASLPSSSRLHEVIHSPTTSEAITDVTEDSEMEDGTVLNETLPPKRMSSSSDVCMTSRVLINLFFTARESSVLPAELIVDPSAMPPPPIPAALDPTTVTSISLPSTPTIEAKEPSFPEPPSAQPESPPLPSEPIEDAEMKVEEPAVEETVAIPEPSIVEEMEKTEEPSKETSSTPPPAPPVRMSFLDWKKKRGVVKDKAAEPASDSESVPAPSAALSEAALDASLKSLLEEHESSILPTSAPVELSMVDNVEVPVPVVESATSPVAVPVAPAVEAEPTIKSEPDIQSVVDDDLVEPQHVEVEMEEDVTPVVSSVEVDSAPVLVSQEVPLVADVPHTDSTSPVPSEDSTISIPPKSASPSPEIIPTMEAEHEVDVKPVIASEFEDVVKIPLGTILGAPIDAGDAEDGEIVDSPDASASSASPAAGQPASSGSNLTRNSRSSTPVSSSSRSSPAPRRAISPGMRRPSPSRLGAGVNGVRRSAFPASNSFAPASPADSHSSSISDRDREDYRYRGTTSPANVPPPPAPASYNGRSPAYNQYPRRGNTYGPRGGGNGDRWHSQRRASPPPVTPRDRDYDYPRSYQNGPAPANNWGGRGRPPQSFRGRNEFHDRSRSPSFSLPNRHNTAGDDGKDNARRWIDVRAREAEAYKSRVSNGPTSSSSFNTGNSA